MYNRSMKITTVFFDLDDTLYPSQVGLWHAIKERMNLYMREHMDIPQEEIPALREKYFMQYGTTLRGLQAHHTHDPLQREVIAALPTRNVIFTNADAPHARRVLTRLQLLDLFPIIVDLHAVAPHCKPMPESFSIAMQLAGEADPSCCVMID